MEIEDTINNQRTWGWKIATYLFLVGTGTGAYLVGFLVNLLRPDLVILMRIGILLGALLVILGILFLIWDLGKKPLAFLAFSRPGVSWISRGTIIITVFVVLDLVHIGMGIWPFTWLEGAPGLRLILGSITAIFALLTLVYTGMALGAAKFIAFWDPIFLPGLFLVSGISTGIIVLAFYLSAYGLSAGVAFEQTLMLLARYDAFVIIVEVLIIGLYLFRMYRLTKARTLTRMVVRGNLAVPFWVGVMAVGLVVPFAFEIYLAYLPTFSPVAVLVLRGLVGVTGLFGGFMLRYIAVAGGSNVPLNVNGILVPLPVIPRVKAFH